MSTSRIAEPAAPETDVEELFARHYRRVVRLAAAITGDPGQAEELAVEVFLRFPAKTAAAQAAAWLTKTAVNLALDGVRRRERRERLAAWIPWPGRPATPEELAASGARVEAVRRTLARLKRRDAALLIGRAEGLSYEELAAAAGVGAASVGTLLARAQAAFRTEYRRRYGDAPDHE